MAHYKRGKPKSRRAGCLLCMPHKAENVRKVPRSKRAQVTLSDDIGELAIDPYPREELDADHA